MIAVLFHLIFTWCQGVAILSVIPGTRRQSIAEYVGMAILLGQGAGVLLSFWLSLAGIMPSRMSLLATGLIALFVCVWRRKELPRFALCITCLKDPWVCLALTGIVIGLAVHAGNLLLYPYQEWDAFAIWAFKVKVLTAEPILHSAYFQDISLSFSHLDYPLLVPFLMANASIAAGSLSAPVGLVFLLQIVGFLLVAYSALRQYADSRAAWIMVAIMTTLPITLRWAGAMIADTTVGIYFFVSVVCLWRWFQSRYTTDLILGSLSISFLLFTKNEGMLCLLNIGIVVGFSLAIRREWRALMKFLLACAIPLLVTLPWLLFRASIPQTHENYGEKLLAGTWLHRLSELPGILLMMAKELATPTHWGISLFVLLIAIWCGRKTCHLWPKSSLLVVIVLQLAAYTVVLTLTPWSIGNNRILDRLFMHIMPLVALWTATMLASRFAPPLQPAMTVEYRSGREVP